jgi:hypothetical protein
MRRVRLVDVDQLIHHMGEEPWTMLSLENVVKGLPTMTITVSEGMMRWLGQQPDTNAKESK